LAQLLHALNQPLTGLQCSLEVTLAAPRTNERYVKSLRDGLALTERMRALVQAVREIVEINERGQSEAAEILDTTELGSVLREAVEELKPVAEEKQVQITWHGPSIPGNSACTAEMRRSAMAQGVFRLLESALALTARGAVLRIDFGSAADEGWILMEWQSSCEALPSALSGPELGLLLAQAQFEKSGAEWERQRLDGGEMLKIRLPGTACAGSI
jgi:signal transduction histidine kinase